MTFSPYGLNIFGEPAQAVNRGAIARKFEFPPFSVLNARDGEWQSRKQAWLSLGIRSEVGRTERAFHDHQWARDLGQKGLCANTAGDGTSIFDPVLCELVYRWFCPEDGLILDPFAGGSVRGIVACLLGRRYNGIDLRSEQVQANEDQADSIIDGNESPLPCWVTGDALDVAELVPGAYDLLFTCPPYADLEKYSDDPRDLSTMDYPKFLDTYRQIIAASVALLKPNRFAAIMVGDIRDPDGYYRNFVGDTVSAFQDAGLKLYNEAILVTSVGSLPIRITKQFEAGRKLGKTHQNLLVFAKGSPRWWKKGDKKK